MNGPLPEAVGRTVRFFESISPADVARMGELYADGATFKDPFNEVVGVPAIARIFGHMFEQVDAPRFVVREAVCQADAAFLVWDFTFGFRRPLPAASCTIRGCSHLRYAPDGRIVMHRDYWDAAEELYEKLPAIGVLMRWLRRRATVVQRS